MADSVYDGFISYSHAADDLLAPRLQAGLQRFAKPWWKRRAVRIFRDESSLAANPHLWSSITEALDDSDWFVLLLSEDAASSEWVGREIEHWVANKDPEKILPVVTDGDFGWVDGDAAGSSVPPALRGVFSEEPRWVDLRFARGETDLDLQNPDFSAAVADVASAIRGVPKDELASEEVRQHRRTVRTAWTAGIGLAVLAIAAVVAGVFAVGQRNDARDNAALANARELAASAINVLDRDPELSILLTLEAIEATGGGEDQPAEVINALWLAVAANRLEDLVDHGFGGAGLMDVSADGTRLLVSSEIGNVVQLFDAPSLTQLWEWRLTAPGSQSASEDTVHHVPTISPDSRFVAVPIIEPNARFASQRDRTEADSRPARVVILDATDGTELTSVEYGSCAGVNVASWSSDGSRLAVYSGWDPCPRVEAASGWWVEVLDTATWESLAVIESPPEPGGPGLGPIPEFDDQGRLFVFGAQSSVVFDSEHKLMRTFEGTWGPGDVSADGRMLVTNDPPSGWISLHDVDSGARLTFLNPFQFPQIPRGLQFSSSGSHVVFGNATQQTVIWDVANAEIVFRLPSGVAEWVHVDDARQRAYTGHFDGTVKIWNLGPVDVGQFAVGDLGSAGFVDANSFAVGEDLGAFIAVDIEAGTSHIRFFDRRTGTLIDNPPYPEIPNHSPDLFTEADRIIVLPNGRFAYQNAGQWLAYDPRSGDEQLLIGCATDDFETCRDTGEPVYVMASSTDGQLLVARQGPNWTFLDSATGSTLATESFEAPGSGVLTFSDDWVLTTAANSLNVIDRRTGETLLTATANQIVRSDVSDSGRLSVSYNHGEGVTIVELETLEARSIKLAVGEIRALSVGPEDRWLAVADENAVHIIDLNTDTVLQSVPIPGVSDIHWLDEKTILIGTRDGVWATTSLDVSDLIRDAKESLQRLFTEQECFTYRIDPCPTLDEIRGG